MVYDHLGNPFKSINDMCRHYNKSRTTYDRRIKSGLTLEEALTLPVQYKHKKAKEVIDSAAKNGIGVHTLQSRVARGMSIEDAISKPLQTKNKDGCTYNGKYYNTIRELCDELNLNYNVITYRLRNKWNIEDAIKTPVSVIRVKDHTNMEFENKPAMCKHWGQSVKTFNYRINNGWSIEKALTTPSNSKDYIGITITAFGKKYDYMPELGRDLGISKPTVYRRFYRLYKQYQYIDIEILASVRSHMDSIKLAFIGLDGQARYKVSWAEDYQTTRQIIQHERPDLLDLYDKVHPDGKWNPYNRDGALIIE